MGNGEVVSQEFQRDGDSLIVRNTQDITPILEDNKLRQKTGVNMKSAMRHAAQIPMIVWDQWNRECIAAHGKGLLQIDAKTRQSIMKTKLNDPDNAFFRTWKGKL